MSHIAFSCNITIVACKKVCALCTGSVQTVDLIVR
jgi:hypothetical protein